jgi:hypothetical protein
MKRPAAAPEPTSKKRAAAATEFNYGFDEEMAAAWRRKQFRAKEFTTNFEYEKEAAADTEVTVVFLDNSRVQIAGLTIEKVKALASTASRSISYLWEGSHAVSKEFLSLSKKMDRTPLVCLWRGLGKSRRMCCMAKIVHFGDLPEAEVACIELMTKVATKYASGEVETDTLYALRDELMQQCPRVKHDVISRDRSSTASKAVALKRPATSSKAVSSEPLEPAQPPKRARRGSTLDSDLPPCPILAEACEVLAGLGE